MRLLPASLDVFPYLCRHHRDRGQRSLAGLRCVGLARDFHHMPNRPDSRGFLHQNINGMRKRAAMLAYPLADSVLQFRE